LLHPAFLLLCNLAPTLVLWSAVVEEVFSGVIASHKKGRKSQGSPTFFMAVGAGLPAIAVCH
jgi:hypothetical protein